jgi:hypothetical protein
VRIAAAPGFGCVIHILVRFFCLLRFFEGATRIVLWNLAVSVTVQGFGADSEIESTWLIAQAMKGMRVFSIPVILSPKMLYHLLRTCATYCSSIHLIKTLTDSAQAPSLS